MGLVSPKKRQRAGLTALRRAGVHRIQVCTGTKELLCVVHSAGHRRTQRSTV